MDGVALRVPEIVIAHPRDRRRANRVGVMIMATLCATRGYFDCMVLDLSSGGAKLAMGDHVVLSPGLSVTLIMHPYGTFRAQTVWQRRSIAGICFLDPPETVATALADLLPVKEPAED
jgi:hypothetical protein